MSWEAPEDKQSDARSTGTRERQGAHDARRAAANTQTDITQKPPKPNADERAAGEAVRNGAAAGDWKVAEVVEWDLALCELVLGGMDARLALDLRRGLLPLLPRHSHGLRKHTNGRMLAELDGATVGRHQAGVWKGPGD